MAMPAKVPASGCTWKARAVPMPCEASPAAKPRARQSRIFTAFISGVTMMAPRMPVSITSTAVSAGSPPSVSDMPIATAAVTDFGASDTSTSRGTPKAWATSTAEASATTEPTTSAASIGSMARSTTLRCS